MTDERTLAAPAPVAPLTRKPRAGDEVLLRIEKFDDRGRARAKLGSVDVHVRRARPGELVKARILRRRGDRAEAYALECIEHSPHAVAARCAHFGTCGGCSLQDQRYEAQLDGLLRLVVSAFAAHLGLGLGSTFDVDPVVPASELFRYRNKMEFTFSSRRWVDLDEPQGAEVGFALGLHAARFYRKVIDVQSCAIQSEPCDRILASARELARAAELAPWDVETHTGLLRHLVLRSARATGEIMVHLVTSSPPDGRLDAIDAYARAILERHSEITTFVHSINTGTASVARGEFTRTIHGQGSIRERACGITFTISADSFFQTNTAQAEVLFEMIREEAGLTGIELVYDLYCGTGAIALILASQARAVVGFEQLPSAVADARANARQNGLANVEFLAGDVQELLAARSELRPDVVVVDPPRAGLHPRVVPQIAQLAPRRIVYVSCNPKSAATDCASLCANGYRVARIRPIDLYPHTPHVECVIRLERIASGPPELVV